MVFNVDMNRGLRRLEWISLVVVLLLMGGIFLPYVFQNRVDSRRNMCEYRLTRLGYALQLAEEESRHLPYYRTAWPELHADEKPVISDDRIVGWQFETLPHLGLTPKVPGSQQEDATQPKHGPLHQYYLDFVSDHSADAAQQLRDLYFPDFVCPANNPPEIDQGILPGGWNSYVANGGLPDASPSVRSGIGVDALANGLFVDDPLLSADSADWNRVGFAYVAEGDGLDQTMLLSENIDSGNWTASAEAALVFHWRVDVLFPAGVETVRVLGLNVQRGQGVDGDVRFARISSNHPGGANAIFVSGRTQFLSEKIDPRVLRYMMTSREAEVTWPGTEILIFGPVEGTGPAN